MSDPQALAVGFVTALRRAALVVPVGSTVAFAQAVAEVGVERRSGVYWAGRSTLLTRPEDTEVYDRVFDAYWRQGPPAALRRADSVLPVTVLFDDADDPDPATDESDGGEREGDDDVQAVRYSPAEVLRHRDFAECSADELAEAHRLMARMGVTVARRRGRRQRSTRHRVGRPDLRRTVRRAVRTGGETIDRPTTRPADRPRRLILLVDVSGSMEPYARSLVRFVHAAAVGRARVEAFTLGTQLTRITRDLTSRDPDTALQQATDSVPDWSGGTRLGEVIGRFNDEWGVRGMARGAVVVILSDGWDRGEPAVMAEQMARLGRVAHRVVWVNPLKATPGYEPLARGMAAALPHVDTFIEGHSLAALEHLAEEIAA